MPHFSELAIPTNKLLNALAYAFGESFGVFVYTASLDIYLYGVKGSYTPSLSLSFYVFGIDVAPLSV